MPRIPLKSDPFAFDDTLPPYKDHPFPGGCWMTCPDAEQAFLARLRFTLKAPAKLRFHVTGDLWFDLRLDGRFLTDGPEWSDSAHWCYASFEEELPAGDHTFLARVVTLPPPLKPWYAMGDNRGFLLIAEAPFAELSTGVGAWEFAPAQSITFPEEYGDAIYRRAVGIPSVLDVTLAEEEPAWNAGTRSGGIFSALTARHFSSRPCLLPARLPEQLRREIPFQLKPVTVPPGETYETVIDLGDYYCFQAEVRLAGTGKVRLGAAEALYEDEPDQNGWYKKLARNATAGLLRDWNYDTWSVSGKSGSMLNTFFRCGRLLILQVEAGENSVTFEGATLWERRYPWDFSAKISGAPEFAQYETICRRTLENCTHSIFMDCPFYERLMYVGDTRVQALIANVLSRDRRLQDKCVELIDWSRDWRGLTASSYPNGKQRIPGFSLIWIAFCHDTLMWGPPEVTPLIRKRLQGVRAVIDAWEAQRRTDGWIASHDGWNCVCSEIGSSRWEHGVPPGGERDEISPVLNLFYLHFSQYAEQLERIFGDDDRADWIAKRRKLTAEKLLESVYVPELDLFANDFAKTEFSEITQILAICSEAFPKCAGSGLFNARMALPKSIFYFQHYYFEACRLTGNADAIRKRLEDWRPHLDYDLSTTAEGEIDGRSDCHAWSAAPLFHWYATMAGIRPGAPGFRHVDAAPIWNGDTVLQGEMPHPSGGVIRFAFGPDYSELALPEGIPGSLTIRGERFELAPGECRKIDHRLSGGSAVLLPGKKL